MERSFGRERKIHRRERGERGEEECFLSSNKTINVFSAISAPSAVMNFRSSLGCTMAMDD
jgi:hypothetical protein